MAAMAPKEHENWRWIKRGEERSSHNVKLIRNHGNLLKVHSCHWMPLAEHSLQENDPEVQNQEAWPAYYKNRFLWWERVHIIESFSFE